MDVLRARKPENHPLLKTARTWYQTDMAWRKRNGIYNYIRGEAARLEEAIRKEQAKTPRRDDKIARLNEALKNVVPGALHKAAKRLAFQTPTSKYSEFEISYFAGYGALVMREKVWKMARSRPDIAYGVTILSRIRCGCYWTASRQARLGLIDIQWNGRCPMCLEEYQEDVVHMVLTCKKWQFEPSHGS